MMAILEEKSKAVEYWVPARFSKVQLELYCSILLSNSLTLRSFSKNNQMGALREILISLRKCCDHPYLVNQDLQAVLTKGRPITEILDIDIHACGKLLLLDKLLHKMRARGLRVVILFQSGNQIGDFLDDFLRQRFGPDAYEHVAHGSLRSKKKTAVRNFNDKSKGRFVFLIENRACQLSVQLSDVDAVIIYDSDLNPKKDTRIIQRINIQPVFRLYSPYAVEEKALSLAKQDVFLDSNLQGVVPAVSHSLLSWGADRLFTLLHQLHLQPGDTYVSPEDLTFVDTVTTEILDTVCRKSRSGAEVATSLLVEVQLSGESTYSRDASSLMGEREGVGSLCGDPSVFWSDLLEGKNPQWRFIQKSLVYRRRKVRPFDKTENAKKRRKKNGTTVSSRNPSEQEISNQAATLASVQGANLRSMQRGVHNSLEPQLLKLCQFAGFPEYVKTMAGTLLEYVISNFKVDDGGDATILQTLVISLCWRAASLFKHWVDPSQLMALASEKLHYDCKADVVESIYCRLKVLKVEFQEKADAVVAGQVPRVRFYNNLFMIPKQEVIAATPEAPFSEKVVIETAASISGQSENANGIEVERNNALYNGRGTPNENGTETPFSEEVVEIENANGREVERNNALYNGHGTPKENGTETPFSEEVVENANETEVERNNGLYNGRGTVNRNGTETPFSEKVVESENANGIEVEGNNAVYNGQGTANENGSETPFSEEVVESENANGREVERNSALYNGHGTTNGNGNGTETPFSEEVVESENANGREIEGNNALYNCHATANGNGTETPFSEKVVESENANGREVERNDALYNNGHGTANGSGNGTVGVRLETSNSPLCQMLPMASPPLVYPHRVHADPLRNELTRIRQHGAQLTRRHLAKKLELKMGIQAEAEKLQLKMEIEEEVEKVRRYAEMIQEEESMYRRQMQHLRHIYNKLLLNAYLAQEWRTKFAKQTAPSASASSQFRNPSAAPT